MRKSFVVILLLILTSYLFAYDVKINGIWYRLDGDSAEVTSKISKEYKGDIVIPSSVEYKNKKYRVTTISGYAFSWDDNLKSITIPNSVTTIGAHAFSGCDRLKSITIPNSVTTIGEGAFYSCDRLKSITIPNSVTTIGMGIFAGCSNLENIIVDSNNTKYDSRDNCNAIIETQTNTLICVCKSTIIPNSVTTIGESAFSGCHWLKSVIIPNSVTTIGESAFSGCYWLKSVIIPNSVTTIGKGAFSGCSWLESVIIPNSVTTIGESAFYGCWLKSIIIPNSVTTIGNRAFKGCWLLKSIIIPNSVTTIGVGAFANCSNLENIIVDSNNTKYDSRDNCNAIIETQTNTLICGCKSTIIPNSVTTIGESAFSGCSRLESVIIPNSVTKIGSYAFSDCSRLKSIIIPNSVTTIKEGAFAGCSDLEKIVVDKNNKKYDSRDSCNAIIETQTNALIRGCKSTIIPNSVTTIGNSAFSSCNGLKSVTIPKSVTIIESNAFYHCDNLKSITVLNGSVHIDRNAFNWCHSLRHISAPKDLDLKRLDFENLMVVTHTPMVFAELTIDSVKYESLSKDGDIHSNEKGILYVYVKNSADGRAKDVVAHIFVSGATKGIDIPKEHKYGDLIQKSNALIKIPVETSDQTVDGKIKVKLVVKDKYGIRSNEKEIEINTHKLPLPDLKIVSHKLLMEYDTVLTKKRTFELVVSLKNEGEAIANKHRLKVAVPEGIKVFSESDRIIPDVSIGKETCDTIVLYSSVDAKNILEVKFEIENSANEKVNNYAVHLEFGKTKAEPKNVIQQSAQKSVAVDTMVITEKITLQKLTSLELTRKEWSKYKSNYAILKIRITGAKPDVVREAKELLNVDLGSQLAAKSVYKEEPNEVWFLIPIEASRILLTCGDGCEKIEVWNDDLENNKVYSGEIRVY